MYVYYVHHGGLTRESHTHSRIGKYAICLHGWFNYFHYKACDEITYPFPKFNGAVEVLEWISNFTQHFTGHAITWPLGFAWSPFSERAPCDLPCVFQKYTLPKQRYHYLYDIIYTYTYIHIYIYIQLRFWYTWFASCSFLWSMLYNFSRLLH